MYTAAANSAAFFTNPHETLCGLIHTCEILQAGCSAAYTLNNIVIDATTGTVTAKKNVALGYEDTVCVKCANTAGSTIT